jgi:glycosyltransferase involved in cell wall biosynthesis
MVPQVSSARNDCDRVQPEIAGRAANEQNVDARTSPDVDMSHPNAIRPEFPVLYERRAPSNQSADGVALRYFPHFQRNPYQRLLYSKALENGFSAQPIVKLEDLLDHASLGRFVLHLHWLHPLWSSTKTQDEFRERCVAILAEIQRLSPQCHIVWTVHNILSHTSEYEDEEAGFYQSLSSLVHTIHTIAWSTPKLCSRLYSLPGEKIINVPHPAYHGCQPDWVSTAQARSELGVPNDRLVLLMFGAVQRYKGYEDVMACLNRVTADRCGRKLHLLVAGVGVDGRLAAELQEWASGSDAATMHFTEIPNDRVQLYFRAADYCLCPYRRTLNSGVAMMSGTFGVPIIAPNKAAFADVFDRRSAILYDARDPDGLTRGIIAACRADRARLSSECTKLMQKFHHHALSDSFFSQLRNRLDNADRSDSPLPAWKSFFHSLGVDSFRRRWK